MTLVFAQKTIEEQVAADFRGRVIFMIILFTIIILGIIWWNRKTKVPQGYIPYKHQQRQPFDEMVKRAVLKAQNYKCNFVE